MQLHKADIHVHTNYSDGLHEPEAIINYAVTQTDLRVVAITDHNTIDGAKCAYEYWKKHRAEFGHLEIIKGVEVTSTKGHILGLFLNEDIPAHMSPSDTVKAIHEQGGIAIAAHPFTHLLKFIDLDGIGREIGELPLDGVEVRNSVPVELYSNWITYLYNRRHRNHPTVGGSDTHFISMLGQTYTWFTGDTSEDFRQSLLKRKVKPGGSVNGPKLAMELAAFFLKQKQLPHQWSNDRIYRHKINSLVIEIEELRNSPIAIVHCKGQIYRDNADLLKAELLRLIHGSIFKIVVDLTEITFIDSAGLGAVIASQKCAWQVQGNIVIANPTKDVALTFQCVRLDKLFTIHSTVKAAIVALQDNNPIRIKF